MWATGTDLRKGCSLLFLTLQTTCLVLLMRISRKQEESSLYVISTVVVSAEVLKLVVCVAATIISVGNLSLAFRQIYKQVVVDYQDTLSVLLPSVLYTLQNNLLYVAISNLNAVTYQVLYQSKMLTTAFFMFVMLKKRLLPTQVLALLLLTSGLVISQQSPQDTRVHSTAQTMIGITAVTCASLSSGFAGVYLEKILKGTPPSVWMRNIQLALFGIFVGLFGVYVHDYSQVTINGFFHGYNLVTWVIVVLQTCGGLGIAFVMKHADNILKGFATGLSILLSSLVSYLCLNDFLPTV